MSAPPGPLSPLHVGGAAAGTQEVLRKHPPALSSCSLHPTGQTSSHVSSQVSLPREAPPPTRTARDLAWCKGSQTVPLPAPAQRPGSLYTHTCPCASPAHRAGGRAVCLAPSSGLTPGGPQQAFLEEQGLSPGLGAAPLCPRWPAPSQRSMIDGPLPSPVTWALDPSTTTSGLSRVWPPWDPGQSRPAEPFHRATQRPRKSAPHPAEEQRIQAPTRRQVQGQASPTAPTSGPQELRWGGCPQAWMPRAPLARRGLTPARGGSRSRGPLGWRHLPLHQSEGILRQHP